MKPSSRAGIHILPLLLAAALSSRAAQGVSLVGENGSEIIIRYSLPAYTIENVIVNGEVCQAVRVPSAAYSAEKGFPELPCVAQSVIIPNQPAMKFEIVDTQYIERKAGTILPSRGIIFRNQNPASVPYTFGSQYRVDEWYPRNIGWTSRPFILRDIRGMTVYFHPVQYNPVRGIIRIIERVTVKLTPLALRGENSLIAAGKGISPLFRAGYKRQFINFSSSRYPAVSDAGKMIVITASKYKKALAPFIEWKNKKGIKTTLYEYPAQTGADTANLRKFIKARYDADKIGYAVLVGDIDDIPTVTFYVPDRRETGLSDQAFAKVAGNDDYYDICIGRLSVASDTQAATVVNKILTYEQKPDTAGAWYRKATGIASDGDGGGGTLKDYEWMNIFRDSLLSYGYTAVDKLYDPDPYLTPDKVVKVVNEGRGMMVYIGHGSETNWGTSWFGTDKENFDDLTNVNMTPAIFSIACVNGQFNYANSPCFAEKWIRLGTPAAPRGAITFLGSSISQPWTPPLHGLEEMIGLIVKDTHLGIGPVVYNGLNRIREKDTSLAYRVTAETWLLFGDPSLQFVSKTPTVLNIPAPAIKMGKQDISVDLGGKKLDGMVCLYGEKTGIIGSKYFFDASSVTLGVDVKTAEKFTFTVSARNCVPKIFEIANVGITNDGKTSPGSMPVRWHKGACTAYLPFVTGNATARITDIFGRTLAQTRVRRGANWISIPARAAPGLQFLVVTTPERTYIKKSLNVR